MKILNRQSAKPYIKFFIIGAVLILFGVLFSALSLFGDKPQLISYSDITEMNTEDVYDFGSVAIVGDYAYSYYGKEGEKADEIDEDSLLCKYYLVILGDEINGYNKIASLTVNESDPVYDYLSSVINNAYYNSEEFIYLDLCAKKSTVPSDIFSYYQEAVQIAQNAVPELQYSGLSLDFYCEGAAAFEGASMNESVLHTLIGFFVAVLGIVLIGIGIVNLIRRKKAIAAANHIFNQNSQPNSGYYYQPNPQNGNGYNYAPNHFGYTGNDYTQSDRNKAYNGYSQQQAPSQDNYYTPPQGNSFGSPQDTQLLNDQEQQQGYSQHRGVQPYNALWQEQNSRDLPPQNMPPKK